MLLAILAFLFGTVLSLRFDVLILLPAILAGAVLATVAHLTEGGWPVLLAIGSVTLALQGGYAFGLIMQWVAAQASRSQPTHAPVPSDSVSQKVSLS